MKKSNADYKKQWRSDPANREKENARRRELWESSPKYKEARNERRRRAALLKGDKTMSGCYVAKAKVLMAVEWLKENVVTFDSWVLSDAVFPGNRRQASDVIHCLLKGGWARQVGTISNGSAKRKKQYELTLPTDIESYDVLKPWEAAKPKKELPTEYTFAALQELPLFRQSLMETSSKPVASLRHRYHQDSHGGSWSSMQKIWYGENDNHRI
jgi:hypothetical protein